MTEETTSKNCLTSSGDIGLFKDMRKYFPSLVIPAIVGFVTIPIVTHLFPAKIYGNYVLVMVTVSVLATIGSWVALSIIRFYPAYKKVSRGDELCSTTIKLTLISVVALSIIFIGVLFFGKNRISTDVYHLMRTGLLVFIFISFF